MDRRHKDETRGRRMRTTGQEEEEEQQKYELSRRSWSEETHVQLDLYKLETTPSGTTTASGSDDGRSESTLVDEEQDATKTANNTTTFMKVCTTFQLSGVNFTTCAVNGLVVIGLPAITHELHIDDALAVWPSSVTSLSTAATLLLAGTVADLVGSRSIELFGSFACGLLMLGAGASRTGMEMVGIRAVQGIALSCHLASSVALVTQCVPRGRGRNVAFACLGLSQPLGFSFGLVLGGVLVDTIGWRGGWYIYGGITLALTIMGIFVLPKSREGRAEGKRVVMRRLKREVDWVGTGLISGFMGVISAFMAMLSMGVEHIRKPDTIVLLCLSAVFLPSFAFWVNRQVKRGKPALIPNSLWRIPSFSSATAMIALSFAVLNALELFCSLFFQEIQNLSALQAAIRILPSLIVGTILNITTGLFVNKVRGFWLAVIPTLLSAVAPLLMAISEPDKSYWNMHFIAQLFQPIASDILFTVGLIVITDVFPEEKHALAGAVFNTAAQFGNAFGLAIMQVVLTLVTNEKEKDENMPVLRSKLEGYRAGFWTMFGLMLVCVLIGGAGFWKVGKIGVEQPDEKEKDIEGELRTEMDGGKV